MRTVCKYENIADNKLYIIKVNRQFDFYVKFISFCRSAIIKLIGWVNLSALSFCTVLSITFGFWYHLGEGYVLHSVLLIG